MPSMSAVQLEHLDNELSRLARTDNATIHVIVCAAEIREWIDEQLTGDDRDR